ncbi:MAG: hypothetical protein R6V35_03070 [Candidatus Nanohaloarchaea archaeon]
MASEKNEKAYGLVKQIGNDLNELGLNESEVSLDVEMYSEQGTIVLDYEIESMGWVEDSLNKGPVSRTGSYSFTPREDMVPDEEHIRELLDSSFLEAALSLDDEVIRESLSPEYDAF